VSGTASPVDRLVVCGVGLIGGSVALGARRAGFAREVIGADTDPASLVAALQAGALDTAGALPGDLGPADLVVVATPTLATAAVIAELCTRDGGEPFGGAVVTDTASVKRHVVEAIGAAVGFVPPRFVPGHPIAGSERSGVGAAEAGLFRGHRVILTPDEATDVDALGRVDALWRALGAEVSEMGAAEHDRVLAMTSHLPHLLAFALVDTLGGQPERDAIGRFAAGGFRDFTRIASSDARMWGDIFAANPDAVLAILDAFVADLGALRAELAAGDREALMARFRRAKRLRDTHFAAQGDADEDR